MSTISNKIHVQEYIYDFAVDGGDVGTFNLHAKDNKAVIPVGAIIKGVTAKVVTAVTSDGAATMIWGNGDDADGYSGTSIGKATLVDNYINNGWSNDAVLLWDGTNDHPIYPNVSTAADGQFIVTVEAAALTAGKIVFLVEYYMPTVA